MRQILGDAWTLARKEIRQLHRDPAALALTFIVPVLMIGALGFAMIGTTEQVGEVSTLVVLVDDDQTSLSRSFRDVLGRVPELKMALTSPTKEKAQFLVESGRAPGAVIIPEGFAHHLLTQGRAFVIVFTDNSKHSAPGVVQAAVSKAIRQFASALYGDEANRRFLVSIHTRTLTGREPGGWANMPGLLAIAIVLSSFDDVVIAISRERERGTLTRLGLTPINLISLYLGKTISTVLLTIARTTEMLLVFVLLLGIPILGNLALVYLVTVMIGICTLGLGFALSTKLRGETTITIVEIIATFPLFALTGALFPIETMAEDGQRMAWFLPWTYGVDALRRVISLGQGLFAVGRDLSMLILATGLFMAVAVILFKRRI